MEQSAGRSGKIKFGKLRQSSSSGGEYGSSTSTDASACNTKLHSRRLLENSLNAAIAHPM
jgi:hypothetical protein